VIRPSESFRDAIRQAASLVEQSPGRLVTFGIKPTYPAECFGYIQQGERLESPPAESPKGGGGGGTPSAPVNAVAQFREKPPAAVAQEYLEAGNYLWNGGIFVWKAATILAALAERQPECLAHLRRIADAWDTPARDTVFAEEFAAIKGISIDYAVLEAFVQYRKPLKFDDQVAVHLRLGAATRASFQMAYLLTVEGGVRATAVTVHGCVNPEGRPVRMPAWLGALSTE
jgi:mannose-1-phosphate guanylyltransferase